MRGIFRLVRGPRRAPWLVIPGVLLLLLVMGLRDAQPVLALQAGPVAIQKELRDANNNVVMGDLSGFTFSLIPQPSGAPIPLGTTGASGQIGPITVPAGSYLINETPRAGTTLIGFFVGGAQTVGFTMAGAAVNITARNQVQGTGALSFTKQIVDASGNPVMVADLSGFQIQVTGPSSFSQTVTTDSGGHAQLPTLAPGTYTITELPRTGFTVAGLIINGVPVANGGQVQVVNTVTSAVVVQNRAGAATGSVTISKQVVDAQGNPVASADRSNFQFTITCGTAFTQQMTTDTTGSASLASVPAGACTVTEATRTGFTLVSIIVGTSPTNIGNGGTFAVTAGQTTNLAVRNSQAAAGSTVTITKQVDDAQGNPLPSATRSGFQFTVTCGSAFSQQATSDASGTATVSGVPAGSCTFNESVPAGSTVSSIVVTSGTSTTTISNGGSFTVTAGQNVAITVTNRQGGATEQIQLFTGCNNVASTFPNATPTSTVAGGVSPSSILIAIWRFDNASQRFVGFSPLPGAPNDLITLNRGDAIFICVNAGGTFTRPQI